MEYWPHLLVVLGFASRHEDESQRHLFPVVVLDECMYRKELSERSAHNLKCAVHVPGPGLGYRSSNWAEVAKSKWRSFPTLMSACRNSVGRKSEAKSKSKVLGSAGRMFMRRRLAALAK